MCGFWQGIIDETSCSNTNSKCKTRFKNHIRKQLKIIVFIVLFSVITSSHGFPTNDKTESSSKTKKTESNTLMGSTVMRKITGKTTTATNEKGHHRSKRVASAMVPIRDRQTSSLCSYQVLTDINHQRIPDKIDRVLCQKDSCKCVEQGDYRCTQLYTQLNVTFLTNDLDRNFEFEMINVEYACVCSRGSGNPGVQVLEPVIV